MTDTFMTAAVFAALAFAMGTLGDTPEPLARGDAQTVVSTVVSPVSPASPESSTAVVKVKSGDRELSGYHDPHDRKRNITANGINSCWVRTRYGTANICGTEGGDD
jgi:hypothetical protein